MTGGIDGAMTGGSDGAMTGGIDGAMTGGIDGAMTGGSDGAIDGAMAERAIRLGAGTATTDDDRAIIGGSDRGDELPIAGFAGTAAEWLALPVARTINRSGCAPWMSALSGA